MSRNQIIQDLAALYIELSEAQKDNFSRITNKILAINYICAHREKDRNDYYFICANEKLFKHYFSILDYGFYINKADTVAYINNLQHYNHLNLKMLHSVVLLLLKKLYFQKSQDFQDTEHINITLAELHNEIEATGLYNGRIKQTELNDVYQFLKRYSICDRIGDLKNDDTILIIYPTINYILPYQKIEDILVKIENYKRGKIDENIDEGETD